MNINKFKSHFILLFSALIVLNSCIKDEGNYDYNDINEVVFEGFAEEYSALRFDNLTINTDDVKFTLDNAATGSYEYKWQALSKNFIDDEIHLLSTDKNIDTQIVLLPGEYTLYYLVKDVNTGIEWQHSTDLKVVNSIYEGWMVLNEVSGNSRLDMISLVEGEYKEIHDVLSFSQSPLTLDGTPGFVQCYEFDPNFYGIYVSTSGTGTTKLDPDTFDWIVENNLSYEFTTSKPEKFEASSLHVKANGMSVVMQDSDFYVYNRLYNIKYSTPQNVTQFGVSFKVSPFFGKGTDWGGFTKMALFDETNKKFVYHDGYFTYSRDVPSTDPMFAHGKDLKYMITNDYNGNSTNTFAILHDPVDAKNYVGMFDINTFTQGHYSEITATDFDVAENIAIDPTYAYIFYNVGGKLYQYDIFTATTVEMLDKGSKVITKIEYRKFFSFSSKYDEFEKQLIVCTYDPSGTEGENGEMELYDIPAVQGQIQLASSYTGFGKIVSVAYRER